MNTKFKLDIEPEAFEDIQKAVNFYNNRKIGLGRLFYKTVDKQFDFLKKNYFSFAIHYDNIRCMGIKKFPYMVHYSVLERQRTISIKAVFSTFEDPEKWNERIE